MANKESGINNPRKFASKLVPLNGVFSVDHDGNSSKPAREFFLESGADVSDVDSLLTNGGKLRRKSSDIEGVIYEKPVDAVSRYLRMLLGPLNRSIVDRSLDSSSPGGINRHGLEHVKRVVEMGREFFLLRGGSTEYEQRQITIAGWMHDIGNAFSREAHPEVSIALMNQMLPGIAVDPAQQQIVAEAIRWHDGDILRKRMASWGEIPAEKRVERLRNEFNPVMLALLMADKLDIRRGRVPSKLCGPDGADRLELDKHAEINFLGQAEDILVSEDKKHMAIVLRFNPNISDEDAKRFPGLTRSRSNHEGGRARVTKRMRDTHRDNGIPHFDSWQSLYWQNYFERTLPAIEAAFAFFPNLEDLDMLFIDSEKNPETEAKTPLVRTGEVDYRNIAIRKTSLIFKRGNLDDTINHLLLTYMPKGKYQGITSKNVYQAMTER